MNNLIQCVVAVLAAFSINALAEQASAIRMDSARSSPELTTETRVGMSGQLTGSAIEEALIWDLTAIGSRDWAKWPSYIRKAGGGMQISHYTKLGSGALYTYANDERALSWTDGMPTGSASSDTSGVFGVGTGTGFKISAPADTDTRTLYLFVGGWRSVGKLTAHLSDGSAPDYIDRSFSSDSGRFNAVYKLTYRANSPGQKLVVTWTQASGVGDVTLQAAALQ